MNAAVLMILTTGFALAADGKEGGKKELEKMQGTWSVVSVEADGKTLPEERTKDWKLTITGDKYTFAPGLESVEGIYFLDPRKKPRAIDATRTNGADKGKTLKGIYQLDGNNLKMCFNGPGNDERPEKFEAKAGSGFRLYVLKREKP